MPRCAAAARQLHGMWPIYSGRYVAQRHRSNLVHPELCIPAWGAYRLERFIAVGQNSSLRLQPLLQWLQVKHCAQVIVAG